MTKELFDELLESVKQAKAIERGEMKPSQAFEIGVESWYNQRRRHSALGYQSPIAFETQFMNN